MIILYSFTWVKDLFLKYKSVMIPVVPHEWVGSAVCDTVYTISLSSVHTL